MRYQFLFLLPLFLLLGCQEGPLERIRQGNDLIGTKAPGWDNKYWINSDPIQWDELRGKNLLIRWWTDDCPFCKASASALNAIHNKYQGQNLQVIGMWHPKPQPTYIDIERMTTAAFELGFEFPIAADNDWTSLGNWWIEDKNRDYTSVSFLVDKEGIIRYIHSGPEFHKDQKKGHEECVQDYNDLEQMIEELIQE